MLEIVIYYLKNCGYDNITEEQFDDIENWPEAEIGPKPDWSELIVELESIKRQEIRDQIDTKTNEIIADGVTYNDIQFKLDVEHQLTYKGAYDLRAFITYPYTVKGEGENYLTLDDEAAFTTFILTGFTHIDSAIRGGWVLKAALETMTYEELLAWTDPR
jgi:hypothetical protein